MKHCPKCGQDRTEDAFWRDRTRSHGLHTYCIPCASELGKARAKRWYARNRERHIGNVLARRAAQRAEKAD
jgi:hypothetical protein